MWKSRGVGEISKGRWQEWKTCLWFSTLATDPAFPQLFVFWARFAIELFTWVLATSPATLAWLFASLVPPPYRSFAWLAVEASARCYPASSTAPTSRARPASRPASDNLQRRNGA